MDTLMHFGVGHKFLQPLGGEFANYVKIFKNDFLWSSHGNWFLQPILIKDLIVPGTVIGSVKNKWL